MKALSTAGCLGDKGRERVPRREWQCVSGPGRSRKKDKKSGCPAALGKGAIGGITGEVELEATCGARGCASEDSEWVTSPED